MKGFENSEVGAQVDTAPTGQVSFDEIEQVVEKVEAEAKEEKAAAKEQVKETAKAVVEKLQAKDGEDGAKDGPSTPSQDSARGALNKAIRGYKGEQTIELDPDTEIEYKVDGKVERVKLADLRNNYSGKVNWDRKNNEFHAEKTKFESQLKTINERVDNLLKLSQEKPEAALIELAALAGKSPEEYAKMFAGSIEAAQKWQDMSDVEKRATMAELENQAYRDQKKREEERLERERQEADRRSKMDNVTKVLGLEADELEGLVSDIQQHAGIANPEPQHVYTAWVYKSVHEALMADAPDSLGQFQEAANVILSSNLTSKEDIRHIIREAYADDSTRKVGRKVAEKAKASQAPQTASAARQRELVSFDEI
jgi:hypothetical protein